MIEVIFFKSRDVSSANWFILLSVLNIVVPSMTLSCLTPAAKISVPNIKRLGKRGQPCLTFEVVCSISVMENRALNVGVEDGCLFAKLS